MELRDVRPKDGWDSIGWDSIEFNLCWEVYTFIVDNKYYMNIDYPNSQPCIEINEVLYKELLKLKEAV